MQTLAEKFGLLPAWAISATFIFVRYLIMSGSVYLFFYILLSSKFKRQKIQSKSPERKFVFTEIRYSFYTSLIFAGMAVLVFIARQFGFTKHYLTISEYGISYFIGSVIFLIFLHDTYFYWMHRWMHQPKLFKMVHRIHHLSYNPTPMAAMSFHPLEALVEFGIVPLVVFIVPIHPFALLFLSLWSMVWNITGHLGYEFFPKGFTRHWFWGWVNTSTHHNMHHQRVNYNYGLYFNIWDRWMHTNHPDYLKTFDKVKSQNTQIAEIV